MKKKLMPTVIAFLVLALLLIYANFFETEEILAPGAQKPEPVLKCQASEITSITWNSAGSEQVKLSINASESRIVAPAELRSDKNEAEGLTRHFAELMSEMTVAENIPDASAYGITASAPSVLIEAAGKASKLILGNKTEVGGSYYLVKEGDPRVFSVPGYIQADFMKKLEDIRDRQLFTEDFGQVNSIKLQNGTDVIELAMSDAFNEWTITSPAKYPADGVAVAEFLQKLHNLRINRFVDDNPSADNDYGIAKSPFKISVSNKNNQTFTLETGDIAATETHVRVAGQKAIHVSLNSDVNELKKTVNDLRDKYIVTPPFAGISEISVADASGSITVEKKDGNWMAGDQKIAENNVKAFVSSISQARIFAYLAEEHKDGLGLKNRENCSTINIKGSDTSLKLWVGSREGSNVGVMTETDIMEINAELFEGFKKFLQLLRSPVEQGKTVVSAPEPVQSASTTITPVSVTPAVSEALPAATEALIVPPGDN